jgi:hypothetical protein
MTKHFCDRCGREASRVFTITLTTASSTDPANDLCRDCVVEFKRWMESVAKARGW